MNPDKKSTPSAVLVIYKRYRRHLIFPMSGIRGIEVAYAFFRQAPPIDDSIVMDI